MRFPGGGDLLRLLRSYAALGAGRIRIDSQPHNTFARVLLLQLLHVVTAVMLLHERTFRVEPFENDVFTLVLGE